MLNSFIVKILDTKGRNIHQPLEYSIYYHGSIKFYEGIYNVVIAFEGGNDTLAELTIITLAEESVHRKKGTLAQFGLSYCESVQFSQVSSTLTALHSASKPRQNFGARNAAPNVVPQSNHANPVE